MKWPAKMLETVITGPFSIVLEFHDHAAAVIFVSTVALTCIAMASAFALGVGVVCAVGLVGGGSCKMVPVPLDAAMCVCIGGVGEGPRLFSGDPDRCRQEGTRKR